MGTEFRDGVVLESGNFWLFLGRNLRLHRRVGEIQRPRDRTPSGDNNDRSCGEAKARNIFLKDHMKIPETFRSHTGGRGVVGRSQTAGINNNNYNTQLWREF